MKYFKSITRYPYKWSLKEALKKRGITYEQYLKECEVKRIKFGL